MASYKVIQDIEAEDKLVGPLSLRQFIYAGIAAVCIYLSAICVMKNVAFMLVVLVPPALFTGFLAFPWGRDQPTEVWLLAKIRYMTKSKTRVWNQSGVKNLVTITVPKVQVRHYTKGLSEHEVRHRLTTLAKTVDSRGWAAKNVSAGAYDFSLAQGQNNLASDRLIDPSTMPKEVPVINPADSEDILDEQNSPLYHQFDSLLNASTKARRQKLVDDLKNMAAGKPADSAEPTDILASVSPENSSAAATDRAASRAQSDDYWFLNEPVASHTTMDNQVVFATQVVKPGSNDDAVSAASSAPTPEEEAVIAEKLKEQQELAKQTSGKSNLKTILPVSEQQAEQEEAKRRAEEQWRQAEAERIARLKVEAARAAEAKAKREQQAVRAQALAGNNDLNIATIARIANNQDEVVVQIH